MASATKALQIFLMFMITCHHLNEARPRPEALERSKRGFLSDIVRASVDEDSKSGKLAILIADNGGDVDRIKDSLKKKAKSKIPFYSSDEEEEKEERRREEEEDREQNGDSSISSILLRKAKDKVKEKLPFGGSSNNNNNDDDDDNESFFGSLFN